MRAIVLFAALSTLAMPALSQEDIGRWQIVCAQQTDEKRCETVQTIFNAADEVILRIAFGAISEDGNAELVLRVPQGTLLREPVTLIDVATSETLASAEYLSCFNKDCFAQTFVTSQLTKTLDATEAALVTFTERTGRKIQIVVPFAGLSAALAQIAP